MRKMVSGFVDVRAISGTHVVFPVFEIKETDAKALMRIANQRSDLIENENLWRRGCRTLASTDLNYSWSL